MISGEILGSIRARTKGSDGAAKMKPITGLITARPVHIRVRVPWKDGAYTEMREQGPRQERNKLTVEGVVDVSFAPNAGYHS